MQTPDLQVPSSEILLSDRSCSQLAHELTDLPLMVVVVVAAAVEEVVVTQIF